MKKRQMTDTTPFRIKYVLNPKTQDMELYFSQGKKKCRIFWEDVKNNWERIEALYRDKACDLELDGQAYIYIHGRRQNARELILEEGLKKSPSRLFVAKSGWKESRSEKEWIRKKKIYASFQVSWGDFWRAFYGVTSDLAANPQYVAADRRFKRQSKMNLLSKGIEKALNPGDWYERYSRKVLACLKNNAYSALDYYNLGLALYNEGRYKSALKKYQIALRRKKQLSSQTLTWCYRERGRTYLKLKRYAMAEKDLLHAIRRDRKYADAYLSLGILNSKQKQYDKALKWELKELKLNPLDASLLYNIGIGYKYKKNWKKALDFFSKSHQIAPTEAAQLLQMGLCCQKMKKGKESFSYYEQTVDALENDTLTVAFPKQDSTLFGKAAQQCLDAQKPELAQRLAAAGKKLGIKRKQYDSLLKKIEKLKKKMH